ncbi:MAG: alanine racemase [Novosphingobium sp. 28-62-57]|uniref:alanine racemase n=1 Tax=unclassified Novosphingobium TaxID=2644732 RepID=UPI000BD96AD3|nr:MULTISPECIES: alanine racemase [unclassified Novosphingobium]OYW48180.1 MAG: alanine racemase [Novosphingobium sp. 12-63-9]OYZ08935.1 MAG: alanine racemase [Novosphingobium sp. 28-62-57]OZA39645.1 MAG: alanine racemase [Novosphingobium sp. 17-62-9]HQS68262.1 alanine racemase [Novosphingobium sp.]
MMQSAALAAETLSAASLETVETPALALDLAKVDRNITRLRSRLAQLGVAFRPHVKTSKSLDVARRLFPEGTGPITVSTLAEAEYFADGGFSDITYAVGLSLDKIDRARQLAAQGLRLSVLIDTVEQAHALAEAARDGGAMPAVLIEIDCDGHRGGVLPDDPALLVIADMLAQGGVNLEGVLTHAGESYNARGGDGLPEAAEGERAAAVAAAQMLRAAGHAAPVVSVGSTPTAHFARDLTGVTEVRAGVFTFFDLVMHGIGVCEVDDIAVSVVATVIGHRPEKGWILTDGGWMAMSRDRGTQRHPVDQGYGLVCDIDGNPFGDVIVEDASQEHGIIKVRPGSDGTLPELPIGARVRILPNHACATCAQHEVYNVVDGSATGQGRVITAQWPRMRGW